MSEVRLFRVIGKTASEIPSGPFPVEKSLQVVLQENLNAMLGVRFLASEYSTGKNHGGRIDTLGLDENYSPVIIEYKRSVNENVVNQGLFYLDWLLDHKADFKLLTMDKLGVAEANTIDWSTPRLLCIAADFSKYDEHAVKQINRNIELVRYRKYGDDLISLEVVHRLVADPILDDGLTLPVAGEQPKKPTDDYNVLETIASLDPPLHDLYEELHSFLGSLGDDVTEIPRKHYLAFRKIKNFACIVPFKSGLSVYLNLDPTSIGELPKNTRNVKNIGHWATGDFEVNIYNRDDLLVALPFIQQAYEKT
jgi:predicted transport protein